MERISAMRDHHSEFVYETYQYSDPDEKLNLPKQFDLLPTSEPEIKGQLAAFAVVLRGLIETLIANGSLTPEQAKTLLHHSDLKTAFAIWDEPEGSAPDNERKRMEEQATRFLESLRRDLFP